MSTVPPTGQSVVSVDLKVGRRSFNPVSTGRRGSVPMPSVTEVETNKNRTV